MYHEPDQTYAGMIGCCSSGRNCGLATTCFNAAQVSRSPELASTKKPFSLYCTASQNTECMTYIYPDISVTDYVCDETSSLVEAYTTGLDHSQSDGLVGEHRLFLTSADAGMVRSYEDSFPSTGFVYGSYTPSPTPTPSDADSESDDDSDAGPIAGGVVGGVAGVALLAGAGFFFFWRKRKNASSETEPGYSTVPDTQMNMGMQPAEMETQCPAEMESMDPAHKFAEAPGNSPGEGVMKPEMGDTEVGGGKQFVAELPADYTFQKG